MVLSSAVMGVGRVFVLHAACTRHEKRCLVGRSVLASITIALAVGCPSIQPLWIFRTASLKYYDFFVIFFVYS